MGVFQIRINEIVTFSAVDQHDSSVTRFLLRVGCWYVTACMLHIYLTVCSMWVWVAGMPLFTDCVLHIYLTSHAGPTYMPSGPAGTLSLAVTQNGCLEIRCSKWFPEAHICCTDYKVILGIGCAIYIIYTYMALPLNWQWRHLVTRFGQEERNVGGDKIAQRALILHTLYQNIYHCVSKACLLLPSPSPVWIRLQLEWQLGAKCGCELTLNRAGDYSAWLACLVDSVLYIWCLSTCLLAITCLNQALTRMATSGNKTSAKGAKRGRKPNSRTTCRFQIYVNYESHVCRLNQYPPIAM